MGTDVASLFIWTMRMHYPSPQWLAKFDGLHPHLAQQMAMQGISPKAGDGISP
jgi:hypothetical protein